jgi:hypothetical protein
MAFICEFNAKCKKKTLSENMTFAKFFTADQNASPYNFSI